MLFPMQIRGTWGSCRSKLMPQSTLRTGGEEGLRDAVPQCRALKLKGAHTKHSVIA